ncbi:hypothetical protein KKG31_04960 [Patescibacteria group bacterium]|nr:hypothetical protein [Patescibacteria group bacterium]MBU1758473.1 hypothetical protein [Patescibacteria group bacterium]
MTVHATHVTETDVHKIVGVHVPHVSTQYSVHDVPTHPSVGVSVTVTSTLPVMEFALSVVIGAVISYIYVVIPQVFKLPATSCTLNLILISAVGESPLIEQNHPHHE